MNPSTYEEILETMQQRYRALSGIDADSASDIGIRMKVLAHQIHQLLERMDRLQAQVFVQTSTGNYLEMHAQTRGIARKAALPSEGVLRFYRETPAQNDIPIAKGVLLATRPEPQLQFETTQAAVLPAGNQEVLVPARAVDLGAQGNVATGSICLMVTPAPGISGVNNPAPFSGGVDAESDDALRERLLDSFSNISNGTNRAFYYDLAMQYEGVASVNVLPRQRGRGTVDVVVSCHNPAAEDAIVDSMRGEIQSRKEINVDVLVEKAVRDITGIRAEISILDGYDADVVLAACRDNIAAHIDSLAVGDSLLCSRLGSALMNVDGVYNYRIQEPAADAHPPANHVVRAGEILLSRMAVG